MLNGLPHHEVGGPKFLKPFVGSAELVNSLLSPDQVNGSGQQLSFTRCQDQKPMSLGQQMPLNVPEKHPGLRGESMFSSRQALELIELFHRSICLGDFGLHSGFFSFSNRSSNTGFEPLKESRLSGPKV